MSKGPWKKCPLTGMSRAKLGRSDAPLTDDGNFEPAFWPDCDIFDIRSFAALCGFADAAHFENVVLTTSGCPIHFRSVGPPTERIYGTHTSSARAGGEIWRSAQLSAAQTRGHASAFDVSSGSNLR